jgi:hypothetical protein
MSPKEPTTTLAAETMRAHKSADGGVTFTFPILLDIPHSKGSKRVSKFQWKRVSRREGAGDVIGGFDLLLPAVSQKVTTNLGNHSGISSGNQNSVAVGEERIVALISYGMSKTKMNYYFII